HVEIKGNQAVWRARLSIRFPTGFMVWIVQNRLRRTADGGKVFNYCDWLIDERLDGVVKKFDADAWAARGAAADGLKDSPDEKKRIDALLAALRKADALDVARKATEKPEASAQLWMLRGELALQLGHLEEARTALKAAEQADPTLPLPWQASRL